MPRASSMPAHACDVQEMTLHGQIVGSANLGVDLAAERSSHPAIVGAARGDAVAASESFHLSLAVLSASVLRVAASRVGITTSSSLVASAG